MYKLKTSRAINKRIKCTSSKKMMRKKASRSHLLQKKTSKRKSQLRKVTTIHLSDQLNFKKNLPYL
uniref:50S ribosomal protein L35 n=3 Tax=Membranoptera TaxID=158697 RepID=A0A1L1Y9Z8_9FLOR|nr:ribosomal protein L35 [Membranoptera platyphylla]YP_009332693.1 ribosomal protein L35 [Membranoptera weeksiae]YP_009332913.1 ribosomal protein L35 [Membranoptera tenuis]AHZ94707.1 ribosomal protein L35 [Membranoptera weeksiae]AKL79169.1 ribosomal protein L35 [Membranoptera tenuis]AMJ16950.1 ribosomal protein L35 [Membranoptera platyphylla]